MGVGFLGHAYMNEVLAWSPFSNPLFGVVAPDSGNQTILIKYGTEEQKQRWLEPSIRGEIRSCYSMTEPDQPGSDPYSIQTRATRDGDDWVISGRKWFTLRRPPCRLRHRHVPHRGRGWRGRGPRQDDPDHRSHRRPGFNIIRSVPVWGHDGDHCEIDYDNVRVPVTNQLGRTGSGHQAAQDRLGAGRVFHCMNSIGQMWRAFDLMMQRVMTRNVHGGPMQDKQFIHGFIADSYIDIQGARLMTIHCAERIDAGVNARTDISAIKVAIPAAFERVVDRAIQVYGAKGVSTDTPLEGMYRSARTLRILDGPDEVHRIVIAKNVLRRYRDGMSWDFGA